MKRRRRFQENQREKQKIETSPTVKPRETVNFSTSLTVKTPQNGRLHESPVSFDPTKPRKTVDFSAFPSLSSVYPPFLKEPEVDFENLTSNPPHYMVFAFLQLVT
jgi:hypothetical protein